ncbi:DUF1947 domain-containing protein [Candidatus Woesearchaeota archaeon]|nr:DUF1947 domain-containing protein [Candidatus Woesearchaeota archaeon]
MNLVPLKSKDFSKELENYNFEVSKKDVIQLMDKKIILINKVPSFFYFENKLVPTLKLLLQKDLLKQVFIDQGAIKYIINGADVMRPGIVEFDSNIEKNDFVVIKDIQHKKPLAVGISLFSSEEFKTLFNGRAIKSIHFIGDDLWKISIFPS